MMKMMPFKFRFPGIVVLLLLSFVFTQCNETESPRPVVLPTVATLSPLAWDQFSVTVRGDVSSDGNNPVTEKGFCWFDNDSLLPTINDSKLVLGSGTGPFQATIGNLAENTLYTFRAYAINSSGISYGEPLRISTTYGPLPVVATLSVNPTRNDKDTFYCAGRISVRGGTDLISRGFLVSTTAGATFNTANVKVEEASTDTGRFSLAAISGLAVNTTYFVRAFASNKGGFSYGNEIQVRTSGPISIANGNPTFSLQSVVFNGRLTDPGLLPVIRRGFIWVRGTAGSPTVNTANARIALADPGTGVFSVSFPPGDSVEVGVSYRVRAFAESVRGISYSANAETVTMTYLPLGAPFRNGFIFWVNPTEPEKGLVVEGADLDSTAAWGCTGDSIGTSIASNAGRTNTVSMANRCLDPLAAARYSRSVAPTNTWDVPTANDLKIIYDSLMVPNRVALNLSGSYWSSSETIKRPYSEAFSFNFTTGEMMESKKYSRFKIRRVRAF